VAYPDDKWRFGVSTDHAADGFHEYTDDDAPDAPPRGSAVSPLRAVESPAVSNANSRRWPALNVNEIFARLPPIKYLLEPLDICPGAPALVAGYGFSGKTVALQSAALTIAGGGRVWGAFAARQGRVLHIDHEQGAHLTRTKYQRLAAAMMLGPADFDDRLVLVSMPQVYLDAPAAESIYTDKCAGFDLVIVDSLRAACPAMEENDSGARGALDVLNRVSDKTGACFVVVHHARKPQKDSTGGAKASIRGSGAIFDACGSVMVFESEGKGQPVRVRHEKARTTGRVADDFLLHIEDHEVDGRPHGGLAVRAEAISQTAPERDAGKVLDAIKERIRAHFREHGDQPSKNVLCQRIPFRRQSLYAAISELEAAGEIVNVGTEKRPNLRFRETPQP